LSFVGGEARRGGADEERSVDADTAGLVRLEVEEYLRGTFLQDAPIVAVSARTGAGLPELMKELRLAASEVRGKDAAHLFRLPIDRAFAIKGFGSVVTGRLFRAA